MDNMSPDESHPQEFFATVYKSENDSSFSIPSVCAYDSHKLKERMKIVLYDLGGSNFTISVMEFCDGSFKVKSSIGDSSIGGDRFDQVIRDWLSGEFALDNGGIDLKKDLATLQRLYEAAEKAKIELSRFSTTKINLPFITLVDSIPKHLIKTLSRAKFEMLCDDFFHRSIEHCREALSVANVSVSDIDEVLLLGNSTRIPRIQELVKDFFGKVPQFVEFFDPQKEANSLNCTQRPVIITPKTGFQKPCSSSAKQGISSRGKNLKSVLSQKQIDDLKQKVEPALSKWIRYKKHHKPYLSYDILAEETGLRKTELKNYFLYVETSGFQPWVDKLRIEEAKSDMSFYTDEYFGYISSKLGFISSTDFKIAFERFVGVPATIWRIDKAKRIQTGDDPLSPKFNKSLAKVSKAYSRWVDEKNYHEPSLTHSKIAKAFQVSDTELYLYCAWVLKESIYNRVIALRIDEAKQIIQDNPSLEIIDVANRVGYSTTGAFTNQFKKRTGDTPGEWRKKIHPEYIRVVPSKPKPDVIPKISFDDEEVKRWVRNKGYCKSNLSLKSVAQECGFVEKRFTQYLRQEEDCTFNEWISKLRLEEAKRILINNASLSTEQVGRRIGFSGKAGFWTWFKQQSGYTPEEWRANVLSKKITKVEAGAHTTVSVPTEVKKTIEEWKEGKGYCERRLTLKSVADTIGITEDQLSAYCYNEGYFQFPIWISQLRIQEAQRLLITYPSMQIVDVAYKVGMTDVKVFRGIFKRIVGVLPTEWRENNSRLSVAEVLAGIDRKPITPFSLDLEKLKEIEQTTSHAKDILSDIFIDEDQEERVEVNAKAENAVLALVPLLLEKRTWSREEFNNLCSSLSIMPGFALERINDIAFEKIGDILIEEEDNDIIYVNTEYRDSLI